MESSASRAGTPQGRPWLHMLAKRQLGSPVQVAGAAPVQWSAERVAGFEADIGAGVRRAPRRAPRADAARPVLCTRLGNSARTAPVLYYGQVLVP